MIFICNKNNIIHFIIYKLCKFSCKIGVLDEKWCKFNLCYVMLCY